MNVTAMSGKPKPSRKSLAGLDWLNFFLADVQTGAWETQAANILFDPFFYLS